MKSNLFDKASIGGLLGLFIVTFALAALCYFFLVGIEICLLATLKAISISFFVVTIGVIALLALLVPYGVILIFGGGFISDFIEDKVSTAKVVLTVILILLFLAIWTFIAWKFINISYGWFIELEKKELIAFPNSFRLIPFIG